MALIPHNRPTLGPGESAAAARVLACGWIAQGPEVSAFEKELSERLGCAEPGVAASSGAAALHLALLALGIQSGDEVLLPTYVCSAVLNPVRYMGARPVLVDLRPGDFNMDPAGAAARRTSRTRVAIGVHTFGFPSDPAPYLEAGLAVIEDCAQAIGASWKERPAGTLATCSVFSFNATKPVTAGAGGMLVSSDAGLLARARDLREYDKRPDYKIRYNYQMTDLAAAVGRTQLARLGAFAGRRRQIAERYREAFKEIPGLRFQEPAPGAGPFGYRFVVRAGREAGKVCKALAERGVEAIQPIAPYQLLHRYLGEDPAAFPEAESLAREAVSLPVYPSLTDVEQDRVITAVKGVLGK